MTEPDDVIIGGALRQAIGGDWEELTPLATAALDALHAHGRLVLPAELLREVLTRYWKRPSGEIPGSLEAWSRLAEHVLWQEPAK